MDEIFAVPGVDQQIPVLVVRTSFDVGFGAGELSRLEYVGAAWYLATGDRNLQVDAFEPEVEPSMRAPMTGYPAN